MAVIGNRWDNPRAVDKPEPGFFELRLVRGGPLIGAKITLTDGKFQAWIDGESCGPGAADPVHARMVFHIWHSGTGISEAEYDLRIATKLWALEHDPTHPAAKPNEVIDLATRKPVF